MIDSISFLDLRKSRLPSRQRRETCSLPGKRCSILTVDEWRIDSKEYEIEVTNTRQSHQLSIGFRFLDCRHQLSVIVYGYWSRVLFASISKFPSCIVYDGRGIGGLSDAISTRMCDGSVVRPE
jgi:hypothetical protein